MKKHEQTEFQLLLDNSVVVTDSASYAVKGSVLLNQKQFDLLQDALRYIEELEQTKDAINDLCGDMELALERTQERLNDMQDALDNANSELEVIRTKLGELTQ